MPTYLESVDNEWFNQRLTGVLIAILIAFAILISRLLYLQVIDGRELRRLSESNSIRIQDVEAPRGLILDRKGRTLVENRPSFNLYIIPKDAKPLEPTLAQLSHFLDEPVSELSQRILNGKKRGVYTPILLREDMARNTLAALEVHKFKLPGVLVHVSSRRHYLMGALGAHTVGYMGEINADELQNTSFESSKSGDFIGKFGVERAYEALLRGSRGGRQVEVNAIGQVERVMSSVPAQPGHNITLTIDADLQARAEDLLTGSAGALVAVDATNGDVLVMASSPTFDPNGFVTGMSRDQWNALIKNPSRPLENKALQGEYPPASTYKIVTAIAGLEEGVIDAHSTYFCPGHYRFGNRTYRCWKRGGHGNVNVIEALAESCDVFFYQVGEALGVDRLAKYAFELGLGSATGINLDREGKGLIPTAGWKRRRFGEPWHRGETLSIAIGQGYNLVTPLQMALLTAAVGNGGIRFEPNLIRKIESVDHQVLQRNEPRVAGRLSVSPNTMALVHKGLWAVVNESRGGTAYRSRLEGMDFSGKTGTAQVVGRSDETADGNAPEAPKDHALFVAYAPSENPVIAVAVIIEHGEHGSSAAAPLAREIIRSYFHLPEDSVTVALEKEIQLRKAGLVTAATAAMASDQGDFDEE